MFVKTDITFPEELLVESYNLLQLDLEPACPYDNIPGSWKKVWSLTSNTGDYLENTKSIRGIYIDQECDLKTQAYKYFNYVLDNYPDACRVRITVLDGYNFLSEHRDEELWRFHVPIIPNPDLIIKVGGVEYSMPEAGRLYYFDANELHSVENPANIERAHLIWTIPHDKMENY